MSLDATCDMYKQRPLYFFLRFVLMVFPQFLYITIKCHKKGCLYYPVYRYIDVFFVVFFSLLNLYFFYSNTMHFLFIADGIRMYEIKF